HSAIATKPPMIHPVMRRMLMLLVCKRVHGSWRRAVHGICMLFSWSSLAGVKLSILVLHLYASAMPSTVWPRWSHYVRMLIPKALYSRHVGHGSGLPQPFPGSLLLPLDGV